MTGAMSRSISCLLFLFVLISICPLAFAEGAESGVRDGIIVDGGVVFLMSDGTVNVLQNDSFNTEPFYQYRISVLDCLECESWTNITQLQTCNDVIAGLRSDGTVIALGREDYVKAISEWSHMTALYGLTGDYNLIAGLKEDGRVLIIGEDPLADYDSHFFESIESWQNVRKFNIGVCAAGGYAAAVHDDGTVSHTVYDAGWSASPDHVVDLDCSGWGLIALRDDGTCVVNGEDSLGYREVTDTWSDLKQVGCGDTFAIGLRNDGIFVTSRENSENWPDAVSKEFAALRDIDHFDCSTYNVITAYRKDGTVELFMDSYDTGNETIRNWTDIEKILFLHSFGMDPVIIGIKSDGKLISNVGEIQLD